MQCRVGFRRADREASTSTGCTGQRQNHSTLVPHQYYCSRVLFWRAVSLKARLPFYAIIGMIYTGWWLRSRWQFCVCRCKIGGPFLRHGPLPRSFRYPVVYVNVAYGIPKYTATRNNKLLVISCLATSLLFRLAVLRGYEKLGALPVLAGQASRSLAIHAIYSHFLGICCKKSGVVTHVTLAAKPHELVKLTKSGAASAENGVRSTYPCTRVLYINLPCNLQLE